jgi:DNA phosphorothioation-associated putative methyltransferase
MEIHTHRTAIKRKGPSRPLRDLLEYEPRILDGTVLDYGCGYGEDVRHLEMKSNEVIRGYDPHFDGAMPYAMKFDTVLLIYVANVIPDKAERQRAIYNAWEKVAPGGFLFVASRTQEEIEKLAAKHGWVEYGDGYVTSKKTFQAGHTAFSLLAFIRAIRPVKNGMSEWHVMESDKYVGVLIAKRRWNG